MRFVNPRSFTQSQCCMGGNIPNMLPWSYTLNYGQLNAPCFQLSMSFEIYSIIPTIRRMGVGKGLIYRGNLFHVRKQVAVSHQALGLEEEGGGYQSEQLDQLKMFVLSLNLHMLAQANFPLRNWRCESRPREIQARGHR